ncbi:MAG: SUMF1/EgtB/PvdO family nonheme iron enzyme, partial [Byssovorax sp.]
TGTGTGKSPMQGGICTQVALFALFAAGCTASVETTPPLPDSGPAPCAGDQQCGTPAQSCCASPTVEGGTYNRLNDPKWPATVSSFRLDAFEVTVGRLRAFVEAYPDARPKPGAGAHPKLAWSGWRAEWDSNLPATQAELRKALMTVETVVNPPPDYPDMSLYLAWSDEPGLHEKAAANTVSWYLAFAFCAWDGGRLPTSAE